MREIKFRGKRVDKGEFVYGSHQHVIRKCKIEFIIDWDSNTPHEVDPETVGQFTGLICEKKKNDLSSEVYEHDIFRHSGEDGDEYSVVVWLKERAAFYLIPVEHYPIIVDNNVSKEKEFDWLFDQAALYDFSLDVIGTKVGNIHENPELLNLN